MIEIYTDRIQAGHILADHLQQYVDKPDLLVLALPRGGVPVAGIVAERLGASLDLMLVRKLGVPGHEELAMGAIAIGNARVLNPEVVEALDISDDLLDTITQRERRELARQQRFYRGDQPPPRVHHRPIMLVDDGLATGASMRVAVAALKQQNPCELVVAIPVAPPDTVQRLRPEVDDLICPLMPPAFGGVGRWYDDFSQTTDMQVKEILQNAWDRERSVWPK